MTDLRPLSVTAHDWARVPWHSKSRRRATVRQAVREAERAHRVQYGYSSIRMRGALNRGAFTQERAA